jgi:hypothetical protein
MRRAFPDLDAHYEPLSSGAPPNATSLPSGSRQSTSHTPLEYVGLDSPRQSGAAWSICGAERTRTAATGASAPFADGTEGVDGSSPSEGSAKAPLTGIFGRPARRRTCGGYGAVDGALALASTCRGARISRSARPHQPQDPRTIGPPGYPARPRPRSTRPTPTRRAILWTHGAVGALRKEVVPLRACEFAM